MRVILWSRRGAGNHYNGPGKAAFNLYTVMTDEYDLTVSLIHGVKGHPSNLVFNEQLFFGDVGDQAAARLVNFKTKIARIFSYAHFWFSIRRWVTKNAEKYDVFHGLGLKPLTLELCEFFNAEAIPTVVKVTELNPKGLISGVRFKSRFKRQLKSVGAFISISKEITQALISIGVERSRIQFIPNGVDSNIFFPLDQELKRVRRQEIGIRECLTIVFCGAVVERKRPHFIIEALREILEDKKTDAQLLLVGPAPDETYLKLLTSLIDQYKLVGNVKLIGHTDKVEYYLQAADLFCLPSRQEGLPNAAIEAMSCGLPIVVTQFSGAADLGAGDRKTGIIVDGNIEAIARGIRDFLYSDNLLRSVSLRARKHAVNEFSLNIAAQRHFNLFQNIGKN